jgi:ferritin-like protein
VASSSNGFHEALDILSDRTKDHHRAIVSLQEELEAIDWYDQRMEGATDPELKALLQHNRDEEKEHASMLLEWLRRRDPALDGFLRRYLFTSGPISDESGPTTAASPSTGLGIGGLVGKEAL